MHVASGILLYIHALLLRYLLNYKLKCRTYLGSDNLGKLYFATKNEIKSLLNHNKVIGSLSLLSGRIAHTQYIITMRPIVTD